MYSSKKQHFELMWYGKQEARQLAYESTQGSLIEDADQSLGETDFNMIIEGDNLDVIKLLRNEYTSSVDLIYLDPPYNTGKDFIYHDRFSSTQKEYLALTGQSKNETKESSGRHHTLWLNMIYPRLLIAHQLLSKRGVIFISIDDHEVHHLTTVLNEIMGEENHLATLVVSLNPKGRQLGRFATSHEYLLVYAKNAKHCALEYATADLVNPNDFPRSDAQGSYRFLPLRNSNKRFNPTTRPNLYYPLYINTQSGEVSVDHRSDWLEVYPVFGSGEPAVWRWSKAKADRESDQLTGDLIKGRRGPRWDVRQRDYNYTGRKKKLKSIWLSKDVGSTDGAARELRTLGLDIFETPKPVALLQRIISLMPRDSLVLDFFAGSGTTGEATIRQNLKDHGSRRYILVQSATPTHQEEICTIAHLTRERMKRMATRLADDLSCASEKSVDLGFKALTLNRYDGQV